MKQQPTRILLYNTSTQDNLQLQPPLATLVLPLAPSSSSSSSVAVSAMALSDRLLAVALVVHHTSTAHNHHSSSSVLLLCCSLKTRKWTGPFKLSQQQQQQNQHQQHQHQVSKTVLQPLVGISFLISLYSLLLPPSPPKKSPVFIEHHYSIGHFFI